MNDGLVEKIQVLISELKQITCEAEAHAKAGVSVDKCAQIKDKYESQIQDIHRRFSALEHVEGWGTKEETSDYLVAHCQANYAVKNICNPPIIDPAKFSV